MERPRHIEAINSLIDFGRIVSTTIGEAASSVVARLNGDAPADDDESGDEDDQHVEEREADVWGDAALLSRPLDPNDDGGPEAVFARLGDDRIIIATRDLRYQVTLEHGECVLRNIVADVSKRATIKIDKDGFITAEGPRVILLSDDVRLTATAPTDHVSLASKCDERNDAVAQALDAFAAAIPVPNDGGAAIQTAFKAIWGTGAPPHDPSDVGSEKVSTN